MVSEYEEGVSLDQMRRLVRQEMEEAVYEQVRQMCLRHPYMGMCKLWQELQTWLAIELYGRPRPSTGYLAEP
ncbi:MAG TPA: hypothetical protein VFI27_16525 [candidate division Zixibacteria bacterium]|nr:hypothetical protein [candidate division Zixibacteria bacterium]